MTPDELRAKTKKFAYGKVRAVKLNGHPDDCFKVGYFPKVAGQRITMGDKFPTPKGGFETPQDALDCAVAFQQNCRDWLIKNPTS